MINAIKIINDIQSLFFPEICFGCNGLLIRNESILCIKCRHQLPLSNSIHEKENEVERVFYGRSKITFACSLFHYKKEGIVQQLIHHLKYKGHEEIGVFIGRWMASELVSSVHLNTIDLIIPVPLHKKKRRKRGYNQVSAFGKEISKKLGVPFKENILLRNKNNKTQTFKNRLARWQKQGEIFYVKDTEPIKQKHILLVDDVITTGATIEACVKTLRSAANCSISVASMAITI